MGRVIGNTKAIYALFLVIVLDSMGYGFILPVLTPMFLHGHSALLPVGTSMQAQHMLYGVIVALYPFFMLFGAPLLGDLSDKIGRKKVLTYSVAGTAIGFLISGIGVQYAFLSLLILGRVMDGLTAGTLPMAQAAIADVCADTTQKAKFMGFMVVAIAGGQILGPLLAGFFSDQSLSSAFTNATPFYVAGVIALLNLVWLLGAFRETYVVKAAQSFNPFRSLLSFLEAFKFARLSLIVIVFFLMQMSWSLFSQASPAYLAAVYDYGQLPLGLFSGSLGLFIALTSTFLLPQYLKVVSVERGATLGLMIMFLGCLVAAVMQSELMFWVSTVINTIGATFTFASMLTVFSGAVSEDKQGWVMGLSGAVIAVAWTISALLAGQLANAVGVSSLYWCAVLALVGGCIGLCFHHTLEASHANDS